MAKPDKTEKLKDVSKKSLERARDSISKVIDKSYNVDAWIEDATYFGVELPRAWWDVWAGSDAPSGAIPTARIEMKSNLTDSDPVSVGVDAPQKAQAASSALAQAGGNDSIPAAKVTAELTPSGRELTVRITGLNNAPVGNFLGTVTVQSNVIALIFVTISPP